MSQRAYKSNRNMSVRELIRVRVLRVRKLMRVWELI